MTFSLKKDLTLGVATSAMQIEGGEINSSWNNWYHQGKIKIIRIRQGQLTTTENGKKMLI